ncbi:hypothetical protein PV779_33935 [Streptomyces sp. ID01-9D]|nr:hypothetical protein [Streptomyces sp. ID01-9D]
MNRSGGSPDRPVTDTGTPLDGTGTARDGTRRYVRRRGAAYRDQDDTYRLARR